MPAAAVDSGGRLIASNVPTSVPQSRMSNESPTVGSTPGSRLTSSVPPYGIFDPSTTSLPAMVEMALKVSRSIVSMMKWTEPSPNRQLTPPG